MALCCLTLCPWTGPNDELWQWLLNECLPIAILEFLSGARRHDETTAADRSAVAPCSRGVLREGINRHGDRGPRATPQGAPNANIARDLPRNSSRNPFGGLCSASCYAAAVLPVEQQRNLAFTASTVAFQKYPFGSGVLQHPGFTQGGNLTANRGTSN